MEKGRHVLYKDNAEEENPTIGYGHKVDGPVYIDGKEVDVTKGLTEEQALRLLEQDIYEQEQKLRDRIPEYDHMDPRIKDVLLSVQFQVGAVGLPKAENNAHYPNMVRYALENNFDGVMREAMTQYRQKDVGWTKDTRRYNVVKEHVGWE